MRVHSSSLCVAQVYYHLGAYDDSVTYALGAGKLFDLDAQSEYVLTILSKCIDQYTASRQAGKPDSEMDKRLVDIVEGMFDRCMASKNYRQVSVLPVLSLFRLLWRHHTAHSTKQPAIQRVRASARLALPWADCHPFHGVRVRAGGWDCARNATRRYFRKGHYRCWGGLGYHAVLLHCVHDSNQQPRIPQRGTSTYPSSPFALRQYGLFMHDQSARSHTCVDKVAPCAIHMAKRSLALKGSLSVCVISAPANHAHRFSASLPGCTQARKAATTLAFASA